MYAAGVHTSCLAVPQCSAAPNTFSRRLFYGGERSRLPAKHAPPVFSTSSTSRGSSQLGIKFHLRIRCEQWGELPSLFAWFTHMVRHSPACRDRTSTARFIAAAVTPLSPLALPPPTCQTNETYAQIGLDRQTGRITLPAVAILSREGRS